MADETQPQPVKTIRLIEVPEKVKEILNGEEKVGLGVWGIENGV